MFKALRDLSRSVAVVVQRLDSQDETLGEILDHAKKTNGRVSKLETDERIRIALENDRRNRRSRKLAAVTTIAAAVVGGLAYWLPVLLQH